MLKIKKNGHGRPAAVPYDKFVKVWVTATSVGDAAQQLGIKPNSASALAAKLRKSGVKLKKFTRRTSQPLDVKALNKLAAEK